MISPPSAGEKVEGITSSGYLNKAHHMEMFGSHFKALEDSATPTINAELDGNL